MKEVNRTFFGVLLLLASAMTGTAGYMAIMRTNQMVVDTVIAGSPNATQMAAAWPDIAFGLVLSTCTGTVLLALGGILALRSQLVWLVPAKPDRASSETNRRVAKSPL
ncbi:hypothetical protein H8F21_13950 [Pseudomonas sp. P66]|uniref:Uncharacterized protein n=1 Tax=Pseudomonas arcuscaelestis TaxID=2710591 RepID=A0ABS2BYH9_9PSED|nr:hypothetical protein [Pseudomonas arcuscaelestis]MBM5458668.1 hypothetical protein [Pseudomonas arcuscaelestis]